MHVRRRKEKKGYKGSKQQVRELFEEDDDDTDSDVSLGRVIETLPEAVNAADQPSEKNVTVSLQFISLDKGMPSDTVDFEPLVDSGVHKTLLSEEDWRKVVNGDKKVRIKKCRVNFRPYGTKINLPMVGRTKAAMTAKSGATTKTIVYVVKG